MKAARWILKTAAVLAAVGTAACMVIAYWDTIVDGFYAVVGKLKAKKEALCPFCSSEYDDYDDGALKDDT